MCGCSCAAPRRCAPPPGGARGRPDSGRCGGGPAARASRVIEDETKFELLRRRPRVSPFDLIAGVPFGGLHLATAFSLSTKLPMIYAYSRPDGSRSIEGRYQPGQTVLIIDDLVTTGG